MPTMVLFTLVGLLLLAVLVLALAVYHLDSYVHKQSKRLQDLMHGTRSGSRPARSQKKTLNEGAPCETCHMCGGLRLRSPQTSIPPVMPDKMKSSQSNIPADFSASDNVTRSLSSPTWDHWLAVKCRIALKVKQVFQRLVICQKRQTQGGLFKSLQRLNRVLRLKGLARVPESVSPMLACRFASDGSAIGSYDPPQSSVAHGVLATTSTAETESTRSGLAFSSSHSEMHFQPDIVKNPDLHRKTDVDTNDVPVHKLVLEILMSPSGKADDKSHRSCSSTPSASSLRLKLAASANLEKLVGYGEGLSSEGFKTCNNSNKDGDVESLLCCPADTAAAYEGQVCCKSSLVLNTACSAPHVCGKCAGYHDQSGFSGNSVLDMVLQDGDGVHASKMVTLDDFKGHEQCAQSLCNDTECTSDRLLDSMPTDNILKYSTCNGELKIRLYNKVNEGIASTPAPTSADECMEISSLASDRGSLHITVLKADNACKVQGEGAEKWTGQVGSPLASINVSGKLAGSSGLGSEKREKMNKTGHSGNLNTKFSGGVTEASGYTYLQAMDEGREFATLQGATGKFFNDDASPSSKSDKKKKKNRGKKARDKPGPLVSDSFEMQEIGKIAFEAIKHVSPVPEREIGCVCGASKGDPHAESCPYPFTSSGSMLQRKIKEQYNILVKSNAAKTLTLAQVGQFTTCLVEAKATLQQKSEMIQRKFTIAKSLVSKADKSSFDRLCGQIYSLEMEQKRLEEDTVVYNRLQEQLKLSPAYKKMLEYGRAHYELQPHTGQMIEKLEPEDMEMSFEELLAQEKKDVFWQRHSLAKSGVPAS